MKEIHQSKIKNSVVEKLQQRRWEPRNLKGKINLGPGSIKQNIKLSWQQREMQLKGKMSTYGMVWVLWVIPSETKCKGAMVANSLIWSHEDVRHKILQFCPLLFGASPCSPQLVVFPLLLGIKEK